MGWEECGGGRGLSVFIVACLAASMASTNYISVVNPSCDNQMCVQTTHLWFRTTGLNNQIHFLRWERGDLPWDMWTECRGDRNMNKSKIFLGKREKEVGNILILMEFIIWNTRMGRQPKAKWWRNVVRSMAELCTGTLWASRFLSKWDRRSMKVS